MNFTRALCIGMLIAGSLCVRGVAQQLSIPAQLAQAGTSVSETSGIPSGPAPSIDAVLRDTNTVVRGRLATGHSYLSADETEIFTDFPIEHPVFLFKDRPDAPTVPGPAAPVVLTVPGGAVIINGLTFSSTHEALTPLEPGTECLLFLKHADGRYTLALRYFGAFRIAEGKIAPLTRKQNFAVEYTDRPAADAAEALLARLREMGR